MSEEKYLNMQRNLYNRAASKWSLSQRDPVVGSYNAHNAWSDYDEFLFKDFKTTELIALEYGCGPGRNLIRFNNRFKRIDGVDIGKINIEKADINLADANISGADLFVCDGKSIPSDDKQYDVVFSVICFQHICCHSIRYKILEECFRVLKSGGKLCFQMGYGGKPNHPNIRVSSYFEDATNARGTNGMYDVSVTDIADIESDLSKIGFEDFKYDLRPVGPGDNHANWIFIQVEKK